jgi:hypothetical protein
LCSPLRDAFRSKASVYRTLALSFVVYESEIVRNLSERVRGLLGKQDMSARKSAFEMV